MDIYTKIAEENLLKLFIFYFDDWCNTYYGINAKFEYNNKIYKNVSDLIKAMNIDMPEMFNILYDNMGYMYLNKCIKWFEDSMPYDVKY